MNEPDSHPESAGMSGSSFAEHLRVVEASAGIGAFVLDPRSGQWVTTLQVAMLFGMTEHAPRSSFSAWAHAIFPDDLLKLRAAWEHPPADNSFNVEIRVRHTGSGVRWLLARGEIVRNDGGTAECLRGSWHDITDRKGLESRLLALTESLEARVHEVREDARVLEILNNTGIAVAAELELGRLVQIVTDAGVEITEAQFGAFFYNVIGEEGEAYTLYALAGVDRDAFAGFPMPRNTAIFEPTFRGEGVVRSDDILLDPRYGKNPPHRGMPNGHLPVRSYLAVPVVSRSGEVLGGLFFGHPDPGRFTARTERIITGIAAQAAVGIDNARLYQRSQQEVRARAVAEQELKTLNDTLEQRVKERERDLDERFHQLRDSESRFRLLVESVTDYAIYMLDVDGMVVKWNPGATRLKGYTPEEIIGRHFSCFYTEEDRDNGVPARTIDMATRTEKYETEGWRVRKDGDKFWASVIINAIRDEAGGLIGFAKITRDLTDKKAAEEQLRQAQKMEAIGQLTGGVAHDFNNLLTIINGNLDLLQRRLTERGDDRLLRYVSLAKHGSSRAALLIHQLLAFSRRQPLEPRSVSVNALISGMSEMLRRTLPESIAVETVLAGGVWLTFVDPNQLENCILNLAVNARDAMPDGGKLTIEAANVYLDEYYAAAASVPSGQYVGIFVSDTGTGMSAEVLAQAFDPFFTTKDVGQGTGLGLSQVYGFVKQSDGHIKLYSEPGAGTTIKIYLPRYTALDAVMENQPQAIPVPRGHGETILVVEDEAEVRGFVVEILRELGYHAIEAADGASALACLAAAQNISLLFTDVGLPGGMNGRQLAEEVVRRRPGMKVLFTSGYARNAIVHNGRLDAGVQLISKPFASLELASKIRQVLDLA